MTKVTIKNTKAEILEAYETSVKKINELKSGKTSVSEEVKKKEIIKIKEDAKEIVELNILNGEMTDKYNNLLNTIELLELEIEEYYDIKKEAATLEALINVGKDKEREIKEKYAQLDKELENKYSERKTYFTENEAEQIFAIRKNIEDLKAKEKEEKFLIDKTREREKEEYKYDLLRARKKENDAWEEEKTLREKVLSDKESMVAEREAGIEDMEKEILLLKNEIETLNKDIKTAYNTGHTEGEAKSEKINAIKRANMEKEAKWQAEKLNDKIEAIEAALETERKAHEDCKSKLEKAYVQIQTMATTTVQASRPIMTTESK